MAWSISVAGHKQQGTASVYYGHPGKERLQAVFADTEGYRATVLAALDFIDKALAEHPELEDEPPPEPVMLQPQ